MCLGVPGEVVETYREGELRMARVRFGGVTRPVCIEYVPEATAGDYVLVHVGFALTVLAEDDARRTLQLLVEIGALADGPETTT